MVKTLWTERFCITVPTSLRCTGKKLVFSELLSFVPGVAMRVAVHSIIPHVLFMVGSVIEVHKLVACGICVDR